jgi:enoyl-CoA hydratase
VVQFKTLEYQVSATAAGHKIGVIRIARPEALNALNGDVMTELGALLRDLTSKSEIRAAILTGAGERSFVAGADIKEMENLTPAQARELSVRGQATFQNLEDLPFPVIAVLNGFALGGGLELALSCDFILASAKCKWGLPEVTLGLIPGYGGTQRLARNVGRSLARRIAMSGEMFTAQQGYEWGLFAQVLEPGDLMPTAEKLAGVLASRAPLAMAWVKAAVNQGSDRTLADGLRLEADLFARTFESSDRTEGIKAFIEKRPADFKGN